MRMNKKAEKILDNIVLMVDEFLSKLPVEEQEKRLKKVRDRVSKLPQSKYEIAHSALRPLRSVSRNRA